MKPLNQRAAVILCLMFTTEKPPSLESSRKLLCESDTVLENLAKWPSLLPFFGQCSLTNLNLMILYNLTTRCLISWIFVTLQIPLQSCKKLLDKQMATNKRLKAADYFRKESPITYVLHGLKNVSAVLKFCTPRILIHISASWKVSCSINNFQDINSSYFTILLLHLDSGKAKIFVKLS